jgi:hypothetical protein
VFTLLQARALNGVNLMATNHVFRSVLVAAGVLLMAGCATQPGYMSLQEKLFQREANNYDAQFLYEGQKVYCKRGATRSLPYRECVTETALRLRVENHHRDRNDVQRGSPQYVATVPGRTGG